MSLLDDWRLWCRDLPTTDRFVDACWVSLISSALQRRVWMGSSINQIWANQYILLIAPPGVGKSLPMKQVSAFLKFHKKPRLDDDEETEGMEKERKLLFPVASDSTSYQAFMHELAENVSSVKGPDGKFRKHMSSTFILDEATSILHDEAEIMIDLLNKGWSCSETHKHSAISTKYKPLKDICINLLGGTQPDKFARVSKVDAVSSGFSRRTLMIFGDENRFEQPMIPEPDADQVAAGHRIANHLLLLSTVYGKATFTPDAWAKYSAWWIDKPARMLARRNKSPRLENYYVSKNLHVCKTAMALHFGESATMEISVDTLDAALLMLDGFESEMHKAFNGTADKFADTKKLLEYRFKGEPGGLSFKELYTPVIHDISASDFRNVLADMLEAGIIQFVGNKYSKI